MRHYMQPITHVQYLSSSISWHPYAYYSDAPEPNRSTMLAIGNWKLAEEEDATEWERAENPDLARQLQEERACWTGLRTVGLKARDWEHLQELCEDGGHSDWEQWVQDNFSEAFLDAHGWRYKDFYDPEYDDVDDDYDWNDEDVGS